MNWSEVYEWLLNHGHVNSNWDCIAIGEDSFYAEDSFENTFISLFTRGGDELVVFVGCLHPKVSVGGATSVCVESHFDVLDYLHDNLEAYYEKLAEKFQ